MRSIALNCCCQAERQLAQAREGVEQFAEDTAALAAAAAASLAKFMDFFDG
jgi:hypothetical protein